MTETPRETPPTNELDHGLRNGGTVWSAYVRDMADRGRTVDLHQPATERAQRRWPNQFTKPLTPPEMDLGEEPPAPIPARPYDSNSQPGRNLEQLGVAPNPLMRSRPPEPIVDFSKPGFGLVSIEEARSWGIEPPFAVALADQLARLGAQLDDADFAAAHDSVRTDEVRPELAAALQAAAEDGLTEVVTTTAPPCNPALTLDDLVTALQRIETIAPPKPIKLTVEQWAVVRRNAAPRAPWEPDPTVWNVPVEIVDRVEDSTPYQWRPVQPVELVPPRPSLPPVEELMDTAMQRMLLPPRTFPRPVRATPTELHQAVVAEVAEPRRSIVGQIWRRLRRWTR
ncbi:hypothetical protein DMC63_01420 [Streptomyces sp. WAC 05977]|nr:hypothetical protein DMC63_01420 [Streptomyces sp. WAC 05977]